MGAEIGETSTGQKAQVASLEQLSDEALVRQICVGCEESLLHLVVDRCGGLIQKVARWYRYDGDLAHDVCVHLFGAGDWDRLRGWRGESTLAIWVRKVAVRLCLTQCRARTQYQARFRRLSDGPEPASDGKLNPSERRLDLESTRSELLRAVKRLSARDQTVILLHCLGDQPLSLQELAAVLDVSVDTAATIKCRAIQRLGKILGERGAGHA